MMSKYIIYFSILIALLSTNTASGQNPPYHATVDMQVSFAPLTTIINGQTSIYYELHVTNYAKDTLELNGLTIRNSADSTIICQWNKNIFADHFKRTGGPNKNALQILPPGGNGVIFIETGLPAVAIPLKIINQLAITILRNGEKTNVITSGGETPIKVEPRLLLGSPLAGGSWAAVYEPLWTTGHRRTFYTVMGTARLPGRFAIDFIKLDNAGHFATGDGNNVNDWFGYATEVLAVRDGTIMSVRDDVSESSTLSGHVSPAPENATGNYISIKVAKDRFVFYEHLKPGSIKVKPGQRVKKGQVLAAIGFTGQSTGPHLHLHVADINSPLGAEGVPFEFEHYNLIGSYIDFSSFGKALWVPEVKNQKTINNERPAPNSVIEFIR
jgi:murein DD-endopeptidase